MPEEPIYLYEVHYYTRPTNVEKYMIFMKDDGRDPIDIALWLKKEVEDWKNTDWGNWYPYKVVKILRHEVDLYPPLANGFELSRWKTKQFKTKVLYGEDYKGWTKDSWGELEKMEDRTQHPIA